MGIILSSNLSEIKNIRIGTGGRFVNATQFDPSKSSGAITFTNNNRTATGTNGLYAGGTVFYVQNGKWYWEYTIISLGSFIQVGLREFGRGNTQLGMLTNSFGWAASGSIQKGFAGPDPSPSAPSFGVSDVLNFALDMDNKVIYLGVNGSYNGHDPNLGEPATLSLPDVQYEAAIGNASSGGTFWSLSANFGQVLFSYPVPSGYSRGFGPQT